MTKPSGTASRAAASRAADDLLAQRAARFHEREKELRRLVTDYHHATAQADKIQADAQARATKITADAQARIAALHERADKEASVFEEAARAAVRAIVQLGEPRAAVASLTRLSAAQVRAIEQAAPTISSRQRSANTTRQLDGPDAPQAKTAP